MKRVFIAVLAGVCVLAGVGHSDGQEPGVVAMATCVGAKDCRACKNCKYCDHCARRGGSCGVKPKPATRPTR